MYRRDGLDGSNLFALMSGLNLFAFVIVDLWVAALVDDGTEFFAPLAGCLERPRRAFANSDEALTILNAINENE